MNRAAARSRTEESVLAQEVKIGAASSRREMQLGTFIKGLLSLDD
jgi:hypothetical protein